ncbi:hypothetical protein [Gimesia panareensis]|uniref:hypothetical protein n=1 Tax=Gimesia panareensis TaxID=2527978 RepID=UPI00118B12BE|nr:hypothetical protein [Gimesia panareensis]QDU50275.1 hypothetical protein Pan110_26200 [Gimesia panareensis]
MSTQLSPSCVCNSHHVPTVEQLYQQATNWPALETSQPVVSGIRSEDPLTDSEQMPEYSVYLVNVPASFEPITWKTIPPGANHYPSNLIAAEVVALLNREKIKASPDGTVKSWFIRLRKSTGGASISVSLNVPWKPKSEYDMPPAFLTMRGPVKQWREVIADLNQRLRQAPTNRGTVQRAYVAHSIHPEELGPEIQPEQESDNSGEITGLQADQAGSVKHQADTTSSIWCQPGSVYLVDVPKDYEPYSWKSLPGSFQRLKDCELAQLAAVRANRRLLERSIHGAVFAWYVVVEVSGGYGIVQVSIPDGWTPADEHDRPEPMTVIQERAKRKQFIKGLNQQLDKGCSRGRKRAYAAVPIQHNSLELQTESIKPAVSSIA